MTQPTYCKSCGAYIPDGKKKCLACGFPVDVPSLGGDINKVETTTFQECSPNRLSFKLFENYTHDWRYFCNGYEINENGQVLATPDDDEIPTTTFTDDTIQVIKAKGEVKIKPKLGIVEVGKDSVCEAWQVKKQEPKPDIDLDDLIEKTFVTVKINDKVSRFYFDARPQMCVVDDEIFGRTMGGRVIRKEIKRKIDFRLVEA